MGKTVRENPEGELLALVRRALLTDRKARISVTTPLFERRLVDSINVLALIGYLEKRLGRRLGDSELLMRNFRSVRTISKVFFYDRTR